jgi:hypothetical protein
LLAIWADRGHRTPAHLVEQGIDVDRLLQTPDRAETLGLLDRVRVRRDDHYRDRGEGRVPQLLGAERRAVHLRHHEVEQDE